MMVTVVIVPYILYADASWLMLPLTFLFMVSVIISHHLPFRHKIIATHSLTHSLIN